MKTEKIKLSEQGIIREEALLAYVNNELNGDEKQELEKLLKDDPFAQEALEGLQQSTKASAVVAVSNINKKVRERVGLKERKIIQLHWSNYAWAVVVFGLLIGVGFIMVSYFGKQDSSIAMNKNTPEETVNLLEKKAEESVVTPVTVPVVTDSLAITEQQNVAADESPAENKAAFKANDKEVMEAENKDAKVVATKQQPAAAPVKVAAPALSANDADKSITVSGAAAKGKEEVVVNSLRVASGDANTEKKKMAAKEESLKKNKQERKEDAAPTTESIVRGSIVETVPINKVTIITMDDAMKSFNSGDYKASSEQFTEILKEQPTNADALYFGGISDYINGNTKKSEKNFDKLLKDGTKFTEGSKWYKANILLKKGKRDEAKKILDELANSNGSYKERAVKKRAEVEF
jgi:tetratricopeptide (TPR) repeat protein